MKHTLLAAVLCLCTLPLSHASAADVSGIYKTTYESGFVPSEDTGDACEKPYKMIDTMCLDPYTAENILGLFQEKNGALNFAATLSFFNGHTCTIDGVAEKNGKGWIFEAAADGGLVCQLSINIKDEVITLDVTKGYDCQSYCGANGTLSGAEFPLSSKIDQTLSSKDDLACISSGEAPCKWQDNKGTEQ